ncbi:MAG: hypothetical protein ABSH20_20015 [Tepidisphaeraceae bacterium]|jgi:hypothetical protein
MNTIAFSNMVRLLTDMPALWLCRGEVGVVRSLWFSPIAAYEVEFHLHGQPSAIRALLFPEQLEVIEQPAAQQ